MLSRTYGLLPHDLAHDMMAAEEAVLMASYKLEPWGDVRIEIALAQIAQILWNVNSKQENRRKLVDFLPWHRKKPKDEEVDGKLEALKMMFKGKQ